MNPNPAEQTGPREKDVLVIIPAFRSPQKLQRCLDALAGQTAAERIAVYVRDNSDDNILFTAAINEGLRYGLSNPAFGYFLMLNQDCYLDTTAVAELLSFMAQYSGVGIAAPLQLDYSSPSQVLWGGSRRTFPGGIHFVGDAENYREPSLVTWANGAAAMIRRETVVEIGLLDENMRFMCSDSDYSYSARARGWQIACVPAAKCLHEGGAAKTPGNTELKRVIVNDYLYFAGKWFAGTLFKGLEDDGTYQCDLAALRQEYQAIANDPEKHGDTFLESLE